MVAGRGQNNPSTMTAVTLVDLHRRAPPPSTDHLAEPPRNTSIVTLPEPAGGEERQYLLLRWCGPSLGRAPTATDIYEVMSVASPDRKYGSYLVGSRVVSDGSMRTATRVDPLYFVLAAVQAKLGESTDAKKYKWQPLDQLFDDIGLPRPVRTALGVRAADGGGGTDGGGADVQLRHLFDRNDQLGDDLVFYKFSEERARDWLVKKHKRIVEAVKAQKTKSKRRNLEDKRYREKMCGGGGAFSSSFVMGNEEDSPSARHSKEDPSELSLSQCEEREAEAAGLQLIAEYLPDAWRSKLVEALGMSTEDLLGDKRSKKSLSAHASKDNAVEDNDNDTNRKRSAAWEAIPGEDAADELIQLAMGVDGISRNKEEMVKKAKLNAQSLGLKRLAKVNTKGMKSLVSFFGGAKKKKGGA